MQLWQRCHHWTSWGRQFNRYSWQQAAWACCFITWLQLIYFRVNVICVCRNLITKPFVVRTVMNRWQFVTVCNFLQWVTYFFTWVDRFIWVSRVSCWFMFRPRVVASHLTSWTVPVVLIAQDSFMTIFWVRTFFYPKSFTSPPLICSHCW